jgi:hypothetical protein
VRIVTFGHRFSGCVTFYFSSGHFSVNAGNV